MARRASDPPSVHSLDHFAIEVPDLEQAALFYTAFGLDVRGSTSALELRASGSDHVWQRISRGPAKRLAYVSFGIDEPDLAAFREQVRQAGGALSESSPTGVSDAESVWLRDPLGVLMELRVAPKSSPDSKIETVLQSSSAGERGAPMRDPASRVRPGRLSHVLLFTPDIKRSVQFYQSALGLRLSDFPGPVAFLHGAHGSDHHMFALAHSDVGVGYHHAAWAVSSLQDVGLGAMQMAEAGYGKGGWGLGRHVLGSNYFFYVRDPWNSYSEYSYDIDFIPADMDWQAGYPAPENSFYLWGPVPPEDFALNYETPALRTAEGPA